MFVHDALRRAMHVQLMLGGSLQATVCLIANR